MSNEKLMEELCSELLSIQADSQKRSKSALENYQMKMELMRQQADKKAEDAPAPEKKTVKAKA